MKAIIRLYPIADKVKKGDLVKDHNGILRKVDFTLYDTVVLDNSYVYSIDDLRVHRYFAVGRRKALEIDKRFYSEVKEGIKIDVTIKTIYEKPVIGERCTLFKNSCKIVPNACNPIPTILVDIDKSNYTLALPDGETVVVKRHYFKLTTRNNYKELAWILRKL